MEQLDERAAKAERGRLAAGRDARFEVWAKAAKALKILGAEPPAISAFMGLGCLLQSLPMACVVVYWCAAFGGCRSKLEGKELIEWLLKRIAHNASCAPIARAEFDAAQEAFVAHTGGDVRCYGPSAFEYISPLREALGKRQFVKAARECLIRSQRFEQAPAREVAAEVVRNVEGAERAGYAGNLVALLARPCR